MGGGGQKLACCYRQKEVAGSGEFAEGLPEKVPYWLDSELR